MLSVEENPDSRVLSDFVSSHLQGNFFQTPELFELYKKTDFYEPTLVSLKDESDGLVASLLSVIQKENLPLISGLTARSISWGGPLLPKENTIKVLETLLEAYNSLIQGRSLYTEFRNLYPMLEFKPAFKNKGYDYNPHLDIHVDLTRGLDSLWDGLSKSKRRCIRKAREQGVEVVDSNDIGEIKDFYILLKEFYSGIVKKPLPSWSFFNKAFEILKPKGMLKYFLVKYNNEVIGGIMCPIYNGIIYEWYVYGDRNHSRQYPSEIATWAPIEWGVENNQHTFDFFGAGSPHEDYGVRKFKQDFGGETLELGRFRKIHHPMKMKLANAGFNIYRRIV